ncbi:uncharacterized protein LOC111027387 isoform X2 [Myzus persicae]|uniref:uncharacterized protein LOC111027387 isoform X2 n=1 Tax=Myzus persicae TaxID=13164 RepID=UPI000B934808|nr:uncharacterized protein LOC111027387 isoform X2 [Myzus persicae]
MIVLFWYLVRLLFTAFRIPKPSGGSHAITFGTSTRAGDSLTTLTMKSSNHSDAGSKDYRGGSSSTVGQEDLIPIFLRRLNDLNIRVGTRTRFLIELDDATGVQVRWYHNNVEADSERYQYIHEGGFYCLDIVPVTLFDEGLWVCTAQNYAGKSSTAAHLSLTVPKAFKKPIFVEQLKAVLTQRGIVSLECKVIGVPTPKLRWYKDDKEIKAGDIFALTANSEEDCLGIYTCEAANVMGTALSTSKIQVTHTPLDGNHDADSLIPYGPPPKFSKFLKNASGKVGSVLFLECQVEVPPWPRSIGWYNDNGIVNEGPLYHLTADGLGMYGVEIKSLRADHSTTWKCVATSSTGSKAVTSCVVSVSYPKNYRVPRFLESLRAIMTDEGLVSFECKVIGYPTPQLLWFKDGKQLQPGDVYELTGSKSLGSYCCVARNCMGETSSLAELTIEDIQNQLNESEKLQLTSNTQPPRFLLGLKSIEANINESFVFMIKVTTESTPSISWYKEDEQITESNRYQFSTEDNGTYILNIVPLEIDDQAEWKCVAINKYGQTATSSFLKLNIPKNFKRPRFLEELRIAFSNEGSVNLECKVIGVPQPQLKWFKDGQELNPGDMHKIISGQSGTCCLGTYTCQAHNCMGTVSSSATLLTMEDKSTVKSCASEEYLSVGNPLVRNESLSTIPEERTSQMEKSYTIEEPADISFSFDGKEVTVSLYETPDLTHDEALQIIEMYADELSEHISEDNVVDLPSLRIVKESSISGPVMMEALVIDVPIDFCRQQTVSDTEFDGVSLTEDITLANNDKSESICENSLEYFSDHLSSGNSKREVFYSASETTPKNSSVILKQKPEDDGHQSFQTPKLFMSDSDDQILTQLKLDERLLPPNSRHVTGPLARSESNNTEEEVSETLAEIENEPPLSHNYCASEIVTQSDEDGLYSSVLNKIRGKGKTSVILSSAEDDVFKIISRPNVDEFLKYMKIILEGTMVKMRTHENFNFTSTNTELERSIQALHSLAWKFIEETERNDVTELDKNTADNVSSLMTAINASLLALEQIDDPFGVSDNVLNEIQSSVCFDLETLNNNNLPATVILDRLSDQIKNFTLVVNRQVAQVTEQRIIAVLRNTIGTTLVYIKTLQQNCSKIKCVDINSLAPLFSMIQPLETILNDIAAMEDASIDDNKPNLKLKQILIPPISSIAFALDSLNTALKNDSSNDDQDLKNIYEKINESTNQFMTLASHGMESNKIAECFISFTKPINDLCCHLRRLGRSTENIVSSDYGSDDKLLLDFETLFDELMIDIDTLINNVNFVQDSENNMNPLGSLLEPLQDMKIGLFQVNQVLLSNQTGSTMSYEVMSCFEHLSQQLVQLNNCIVNQSIVEETDKEIPFESSIKMMQNILFDDAIDDLGVNGILFGSVMKPLLQLQNLIVSKMASVESDLSFSEHTDVTGGACDTQSLSLSLSNNAQTFLDKTANENSKQVIIESSIIDSSNKGRDKQNNIRRDTSEIEKDSILFENDINNENVVKRGFECDIGETFKYDEPNIITSEDDRDNSGFEALFQETDLETISDFVEDVNLDNIMISKVDHKLSDLIMDETDIDTMQKKTDDIIPEHVLETLDKINQHDLVLNSSVDLFEELQETLKTMTEVARDETSEMHNLDNNTSNTNDSQNVDSTYMNPICDKVSYNALDNSLDVDQNDENETFKNKHRSINDQNTNKESQIFEIGQDVDFVENLESLDSDKSVSNNTIISIHEISDLSEVKIKEIDHTKNVETVFDLFASKTGNVPQIEELLDKNETSITSVDVSNGNKSLITSVHNVVSKINDNDAAITTLFDLKNGTLEQTVFSKLNSTESIQNLNIVSNEDIKIDKNKFNESENINTLNNDNDIENKDTMLIKEAEVQSITENVSDKSFTKDDAVVNENDAIDNLGTDMVIQVEETRNGNEYNTDKGKQIILIDECTNETELNKMLRTLVEEKNLITPENKLVIGDNDSKIIDQDDNLDKKLQHDVQPNVNKTSTTDNMQIVLSYTNCENVANQILNVLQTEKCDNRFENNDIIDDMKIKSKNNVINDFKDSFNSILNEKEADCNMKINIHPENKIKGIVMGDEEKSTNKLNTTFSDLKQSTILEKHDTDLSENTLINNKIITLESTQSIDPFKLEENHFEKQFTENMDSKYEHNTALDDKENMVNNLEYLDSKNEIKLSCPYEMINKDEENSPNEVQFIQNDEYKLIKESANIVVEPTTALICNETILVSNAQPLDTVVIDFENIKEQYEKDVCISESKNKIVLEDVIDNVEKNNQQSNDGEPMSKDKLLLEPLHSNNVTYDENKSEKSITNDCIESQTSKSIDEKSNSVSSNDAVMDNGDILKTINNFGADDAEEKIMTKLKIFNEGEVTTFLDLEKTKSNIEKVDNSKIFASEINCLPFDNDQVVDLCDAKNNLAKNKGSFLAKENGEECNEVTSQQNTCIEILNENNANQQKQFTECPPKVPGNFEKLVTLSLEETRETNTVSNVEKLNRSEDNLEINKTSATNSIENNTNKEQNPNSIDVCESLENNTVLVNNRNQTICLNNTELANANEKLTEDLENIQELSGNNFEKPFDYKNNLGGADNFKNDENTETEEIKKEFINLMDLETSKRKLETTTVNTPRVDSDESTKQEERSTLENLSNLVIDDLNISFEAPKNELSINKNIDSTSIESSNSNISISETLQINATVDIIDQHKDISKTETQETPDNSKEREIKDYSGEIQSCKSNLPLSEFRDIQESNTIDGNKENEHSKKGPDGININEDKLINEVKMNYEINVDTALENSSIGLNDYLLESKISDVSAAEKCGVLSILPKLHCAEKIASDGTECVILENTNNLKNYDINAAENDKQHARVEHELNIAAIGNSIIDYDSVKEISLTEGEENKFTAKVTTALTFDNHSFEIVSTNVDILNDNTKDTKIKDEQIVHSDTNEVIENSSRSTTHSSENENPEVSTVDKLKDEIENTDNFKETVQTKTKSMHNTTELYNDDTSNHSNVDLKKNNEGVEKLQQSLENANQMFESSVVSVEKHDNNDDFKSDNRDKTNRGSKKEKSGPQPDDKKSPSPDKTISKIIDNEENIDTTIVINKSVKENINKLSDDNKDTIIVEVEMDKTQAENVPENIIEKAVLNVNENENQKNSELSTDDKIKSEESNVEIDKTKRGSKKKKSSPKPDDTKSPSPDTTKSNINVGEINTDTAKIIDKRIEENNKNLSHDNKDTEKVEVEMNKKQTENVPEKIIEKVVFNVNENENQKNSEISTDDKIKSEENNVEKDKTKRGSKKKKSSPKPDDTKSPSPDKTISKIIDNEENINTTILINKSVEENINKLSDDNKDTVQVGVEMDKTQAKIIPEKIIEKAVLNVNENENQKNSEISTDDTKIKSEVNNVEKDKTKRGSKKKKSSPQPDDTKSPSPDKTISKIIDNEENINTTKIIDKSIEENNKNLPHDNKDTEKNGVEMDKTQAEIIPEKINEKAVLNVNENENQKNSEISTDDTKIKSEVNNVEKDKTKRGSKKKKSSPQPDDTKSPSPDKTISKIIDNEENINTTKIIDKSIEENNKNLPHDNKDTEKNGVEMDKTQAEIIPEKINEKAVLNVNENENQKNSEISTDDTKIKSEVNNVEKDKTKRGSKKKKSSPKPDDTKSPSPDTTKSNINVGEMNTDTAKIIDKSIEENNKNLSHENKDTEKVKVEMDKKQTENVPEKITEKAVINVNENESQKNSEISTDDIKIKSEETNVEKDKTKRGSKKKKSIPQAGDVISPLPNSTKSDVSVSEMKVDTTKCIDNSLEENNKKLSHYYEDIECAAIEVDKIEPEIASDNNLKVLGSIEKDVSTDKTSENQKNILIDVDDNTLVENGMDKNKKTILESEYQIPISKPSLNIKTNKIDSIFTDEIVEDNNRKISDNYKNYARDGTKIELETAAGTNKSMTEIFEDQNDENNRNDDEIKATEKDKTKRVSKKENSSKRSEGKRSTSADKKENTISDLTENFTEQLPNRNTTSDKLEQAQKICSSENSNIEIIGKSKKNIIDTHLLSNTNKSIADYNKKEQEMSAKSTSLEKSLRTHTTVNDNFDNNPNDNKTNCLTGIQNERKLTGMTNVDNVVDVPEARSLDKRPVNRYLLDVTDAHKSRPNTLAYRSLTPDHLTSYRSLTPDHLSSYRSLTPESPSYRSSLTPRTKYSTPTRYTASSDKELYGGSSSSHSSRGSSRSTSPYPPESRISARSLWPTNVTAYRCLSETSIPLSPRRAQVETNSGWPHTSYGLTTRRRRGSDSFLHDSGVRDGGYYSSWRLSDGRAAIYNASEDLYRTKEAFKGLHFCVRLIDQTVSSGARVKFWCSVIGHPEPRVQWYRDGQKLNSFTYNSSARYQTKYDGGLAQLIIENAQSGDSGEYTCVASNGRDRISTTGFLTVYTSPSVFRKPLQQPSLSVDSIESGRGLYSRTSHDFRLSSNDKFDFSYQKFAGDLASRRPEYPKFVSSIIADDVATYGGTIALQVRVQGSPVPNVTWMRESRPLPRLSGKYVYLDEGGLYTLLVMDSTARDGGKYVCRACNLYGAADAEKAVRVVSPQDYTDRRGVKPAIIVSRPNDRLNVAVGEDITVTLRVAGEPKPKVIWMRGSRDVTFLDRSLKETVNDYVMLSIKKAQPSDAGTYFIIAKNVYGSDRAFVTVGVRKRARSLTPPQIRNTIGRWFRPSGGGRGGRGGCANNEVPGPVRSEPTVTDRTNNRISLQWDRPEKPETVLVYRVETRSADEECWRQVGMTPTNTIDVYNLKPGNRYQFRVAARNRFGWSQPVASEGYVDVFEPKCLPEFRQPLPGQTRVLLRHSATLQCHVRGIPEPSVRWFKDGEPLLASDRHAVGLTDAGKCTLTIADAADADAGRYSCEAVNDQGRVCTLTVVQVIANRKIVEAERRLQGCLMKNNDFKESAPVFTKHLIDRRVDINSTVRLSCQVNGLPAPLVLWYKDGRPVDFESVMEGDRKPPVRDDSNDFYTLELTGVKYDDSGAYAAVASNAIGKASTRCVLEVFNKNRTDPAVPTFVFGLPTTSEAVDSIVLSAQIDAYRPAKVEWFRDGIQLRNGRRVDIITDHDGNLELRIACVTDRDSGTYMLRVSNDTGTIESRCDVNVVEREHKDTGMEQISLMNHLYSKKPKFVVKPKFQEVEEGQEVIIDSEIVGDPLPKITWLRDGLKPEYYRDNSEFLCVSNGNRYQLKIPHAKLTHTGTYTLLAANPHGQIKALISLQVYSTGHCKKKMENGTNYATVERLPRISRGLVDIECRENDSVSFECKLNITQETDIRWQKDGKLVRLGKQIKSQLVDGDTARLDISTASPLHEGLYTCTAFNELGQDSTSARLILLTDSQDTATATQSNGQRNTMLNSPILAGETNDRSTKRLKRSSAPKFYAVLHDRIADVGETVRFLCSVSGHPPPWSSWEKDGQPIGVNSRMRIREDDDHRSLEICDVIPDDAGLYRITVENKFGKIQATARLEVLTHNQTTNDVQITSSSNGRRQSGSAACAGENFTLSCDIRGNSMSDVTWYKDDEKIESDGRVTSSLDDLAARLSISNLESMDTGVYTCVARCESGVTRCSTELCVFDTKPATDSYLQPPIFVEGLVPKRTADEGEPVQLTVRLQGAVPMSASWFKNDVLVPDCADFEYVVADDRGEFGLSIIDPFVKDSGTYSCKVANTFGQAVSSGQLIINEMSSEHQEPLVVELNNNLQEVGEKAAFNSTATARTTLPASILSGPCDTTVLRGAKVVLKTSYQGDPEPCVQWLRGGKVLESNTHLCITNERGVSSLTIDSITADDCGKYVVRVDNGHGNDFHFASVAVEGPPDPPAGRPVVSVSETSADVTWSSPAYDGGCMVTGYGVEVRPFNQSDWKLVADKCHSLSHIVRGLAPGESYVFRVRAENMHGSSEASLESTPVYILQTDYGNTLWPKTVNIEKGEQFDGQYEVLDELGKGRYGVVYKVKERETNKYYAAKFVRCIKSTDKEKAQEEVDIMNCLRHPKLLQLDAAFDKPREVVLVTEYISGGELFERVVADDFTLTEKDCILFTRQICEGVDYMHKQNVVHLDLKPENIMCQSRTSHYVKLIDFGLAQKIIPGQPMRVLFGTPEFIPPEIIGYEPIGLESDMWSVGVICYVLLSGLSPFMGDNDPETFTNITKAEFDFDDEAFDAVSQDAKDFISALLIKRKELRLTARECLKHKWLAQQDMDMSCVILSTDKLKKFIIRRKWQKTGNAIRALGRMATLSAASRRGVSGGGGTGGGCGTGIVLQKLKMASLREEEAAGESHSEAHEIAITETTKNGSGHKSCDARSDSGFSDCPSIASPTAMLVRPAECPSAISEETPPVSDQDRFSPPPTHGSSSPITRRSSSPTTHRSPSPTTRRSPSPTTRRSPSPTTRCSPSAPLTCRPSPPGAACHPSSPATHRPASPATRRPFSPTTHRSSSPTTRGSSYPATRGPSPLATHLRSPLPRNRRDATHTVHDVPLPAGTGVSGVCKTNRIIFDSGRRDGNASSPGMGGGGVQRKEPIRIQTADNFKKAVAFWKQ